MKTEDIYKLFIAFLVIGSVAFWTIEAGGVVQAKWPKPPELVLQECKTAERSIKPNPLSGIANDFSMITTYEEYRDTGPIVKKEKKKPEAPAHAKALNAYLVLGVLFVADNPVGFVHYMGLIVTERNIDESRSAAPALRRWILVDQDGDSLLDKATFSESINPTSDEIAGSAEKMEIPAKQVASLQGYFEEAVGKLSKKAANGPADTCSRL